MKIAVSSDDAKTICGHLGRCTLFIVFEIEGEKIKSKEIRSNTYTSHALGDCSHEHHSPGESNHSHQSVISALRDCQVVIS